MVEINAEERMDFSPKVHACARARVLPTIEAPI
jgi:hypothetical protein